MVHIVVDYMRIIIIIIII